MLENFTEIEVYIIDGMAGQNIFEKINKIKPDIIGFTSTTLTIKDAYAIADRVRMENPSILIIFGGVHASAMPEEALEHSDIVIQGEGESALKKIVDDFIKDPFKTKQQKGIIRGDFVNDINLLPPPAWQLMDMEYYIGATDNTAKTIPYAPADARALTITTSRGCPYRCIFCHNSGRFTPVRYFSADRVFHDLNFLVNKYGLNTFFFADDEMIVNQDRLNKLLTLFEQNGLKERITWGCQARSDAILRVDLGILSRMKDNGCSLVSIGMESGSQRVLDILKKQESPETHVQAMRLCRQAGLKVSASFMFGTPGETKQDMLESLEFIKNNIKYLDLVGIGITTPYPGTELWKMAIEKKLINKDINYGVLCPDSDMGFDDERLIVNTMSKKEFKIIFQKIKTEIKEQEMRSGRISANKMFRLFLKHPIIGVKYIFTNPLNSFKIISKFFASR